MAISNSRTPIKLSDNFCFRHLFLMCFIIFSSWFPYKYLFSLKLFGRHFHGRGWRWSPLKNIYFYRIQSTIKHFQVVTMYLEQVNCLAYIFVPSRFHNILFFPPRSPFLFSCLWLLVSASVQHERQMKRCVSRSTVLCERPFSPKKCRKQLEKRKDF